MSPARGCKRAKTLGNLHFAFRFPAQTVEDESEVTISRQGLTDHGFDRPSGRTGREEGVLSLLARVNAFGPAKGGNELAHSIAGAIELQTDIGGDTTRRIADSRPFSNHE